MLNLKPRMLLYFRFQFSSGGSRPGYSDRKNKRKEKKNKKNDKKNDKNSNSQKKDKNKGQSNKSTFSKEELENSIEL